MIKNIIPQLQEAYALLPKDAKRIAWQIHGVEGDYFRKIIAGTVKDQSVYYNALNAVKQASNQYHKSLNVDLEKIKKIEVIEPEFL